MYNIYFNEESNELILNFEEIAEHHSEYLDDCYESLEKALNKYSIHKDRVDSVQDYWYSISPTESESDSDFEDLENYLIELFEDIEERIEEDLEEDLDEMW